MRPSFQNTKNSDAATNAVSYSRPKRPESHVFEAWVEDITRARLKHSYSPRPSQHSLRRYRCSQGTPTRKRCRIRATLMRLQSGSKHPRTSPRVSNLMTYQSDTLAAIAVLAIAVGKATYMFFLLFLVPCSISSPFPLSRVSSS